MLKLSILCSVENPRMRLAEKSRDSGPNPVRFFGWSAEQTIPRAKQRTTRSDFRCAKAGGVWQ
jgi:hypothetical protein